MRHTTIHAPIVAIMTMALLVLTGWVGSTAASAAGRHIYLAANGANPQSATIAPSNAAISGDSSLFLDHMTWTRWNDRAIGTGTASLNLCEPDCAAGKTVAVPVTVTLSAPQTTCGREFFTDMRLTLTGRVPAGLTSTTTVPITPFC
jgi:hypothetical protein